MSRTSSPRRSATRLRLYEAAAALLAERGAAETTMEEVADRAGVAKGTLYYNFRGRAEFFEALLRYSAEEFSGVLREAGRSARARGLGAPEQLHAMVRAGLVFAADRPGLVQLHAAERWRPGGPERSESPQQGQQDREPRCPALEVLEDALRAAAGPVEAGRAPDPGLTAAGLLGMVVVTAMEWRLHRPERSVAEVHAALVPLLPRPRIPRQRHGD